MKIVNRKDGMFAEERIENQEIYCHNCDRYVQFPIDLSMNGNHVLHCPNCNHEHCRVVRGGVITGDRWDQRNGNTYQIRPGVITVSTNSTTSASTGWSVNSSWGTSSTSSSVIYYNTGT